MTLWIKFFLGSLALALVVVVGLLLPLNLLAIAWSRDRGLFTWGTLWRVSLVVAQAPEWRFRRPC